MLSSREHDRLSEEERIAEYRREERQRQVDIERRRRIAEYRRHYAEYRRQYVEKCEEQRRLHAIEVQVTRDILFRKEDLARHGFIEKGDQGPQDYHVLEHQRREAERAERKH